MDSVNPGRIAWKPFLTQWSRELMRSELAAKVSPQPTTPDWLGVEAATAKDIAALEKRLGMKLPPSYKSFLLTTNGWSRATFAIGRLRSADAVDWYRVENAETVATWSQSGSTLPDEDYYDYKEGVASDHRGDHMELLVQISDYEDGVYLLNPNAVTPDGEWEAWFFANWIPGAERYPSFAHLMVGEFRSFVKCEERPDLNEHIPRLPAVDPRSRRTSAVKRKSPKAAELSVEELIEQMQSSEPKAKAKALRIFSGKLKGRPNAERDPTRVRLLSELFYATQSPDVKCACVAGITEWAMEGTPPDPLLDSLSDPDPSVILQGIFALAYFPQAAASEPLCKFIESQVHPLYKQNAIVMLSRNSDARSVAAIASVLLDTTSTFDQIIGTAGMSLGRMGDLGIEELVKALDHPDARVRHAAVCGIDVSGNKEASLHLKRMQQDSDPKVRIRASNPLGDKMPRYLPTVLTAIMT